MQLQQLFVFYRNVFLAVRNTDNGFFLCQSTHNVQKTSTSVRIRWLSEDETKKNIYRMDYTDSIDVESILTEVSLNKLGKGKFELTNPENQRIDSILKEAVAFNKC